ncbi:MAG: hypothetical protein IT177_11770 [Acidobacteria bacterium]|nr:hypothetical protein [Acidobacteriota bacterium]
MARSLPARTALRLAATFALALAASAAAGRAAQPTYFPDDPIAVDPETQDARQVREWDLSDLYDFVEHSFLGPGDKAPIRAVNVNTIDEVPDSSWFTNRAGTRPLTADEVRRGPDTTQGPAPGKWTVVSGKSDGITPGFTIRDTAGITWFIKFDPDSNPEMATGAEMVSTKLFWALGFHVPENHLAVLRRENLEIAPDATIRDIMGRRRRLTEDDVRQLLMRGARKDDGSFRVVASRALEGRPIGPFRYYGTRPDDPNDIHLHEHRRELRGMRAFSAWLNHDDSRSINSLDTIVERNGRQIVWHHLIDFGSTLGSGSLYAQKARAGNEYLWEARPTIITALTLGLYVRPWIRVHYPDIESLGRIEATFYQPEAWKPEYPNPAFNNARPDDLFWAARKVMAVSDDVIRAAVAAAQYSDPAAATYLTDVIMVRRDKVGLAWLTGVNPLVDFALTGTGTLSFRNIAADTRRAPPAQSYEAQWARFDNATGTATPVGTRQTSTTLSFQAPPDALAGDFVQVAVSSHSTMHAAWATPVIVRFRKGTDGWVLVGLERLPDTPATGASR